MFLYLISVGRTNYVLRQVPRLPESRGRRKNEKKPMIFRKTVFLARASNRLRSMFFGGLDNYKTKNFCNVTLRIRVTGPQGHVPHLGQGTRRHPRERAGGPASRRRRRAPCLVPLGPAFLPQTQGLRVVQLSQSSLDSGELGHRGDPGPTSKEVLRRPGPQLRGLSGRSDTNRPLAVGRPKV